MQDPNQQDMRVFIILGACCSIFVAAVMYYAFALLTGDGRV